MSFLQQELHMINDLIEMNTNTYLEFCLLLISMNLNISLFYQFKGSAPDTPIMPKLLIGLVNGAF